MKMKMKMPLSIRMANIFFVHMFSLTSICDIRLLSSLGECVSRTMCVQKDVFSLSLSLQNRDDIQIKINTMALNQFG